jgi:hypothetical protein
LEDVNLEIHDKSVKPMVTSTEDDLKSSNCVIDNTMIVNKTRVSKKPKKNADNEI